MTEFLSWESLGTFAGALFVTGLLTQAWKSLFNLGVTGTRASSALTGIALLVLVTVFTKGATPQNVILAVLNGLLVGFAANGAYDNLIRKEAGP